MPGVGVPFGFGLMLILFASGMPGVEFPDGDIGLSENPSGKFASSIGFTFDDVFVFVVSVLEQAIFSAIKEIIKINKAIFDIIKYRTSVLCKFLI